jgi:hypothetical protein
MESFPTRVKQPLAADYQRIGGGAWPISAYLLRNDLPRLKEAYMYDHASFSIVAALLLTISSALLMYAPSNFSSELAYLGPMKWTFVISTSLSVTFNVMTIVTAGEMLLCSNSVPAEAFHFFMIECTHTGPSREPSFWGTLGYMCLLLSLVSNVYLVYGGFFWLPLCVSMTACFLYHCYCNLSRWRAVALSLERLCSNGEDLEVLRKNAASFPPMWSWKPRRTSAAGPDFMANK